MKLRFDRMGGNRLNMRKSHVMPPMRRSRASRHAVQDRWLRTRAGLEWRLIADGGRFTACATMQYAGDLPDVSKVLAGIAHASDHQATLHGVVFDISGATAARPRLPNATGADLAGL